MSDSSVEIANLGDFAREQTLGLFDNGFVDAVECNNLISDVESWNNIHYFPVGEVHDLIMRNLIQIRNNHRKFYEAEVIVKNPDPVTGAGSNVDYRGNKLVAYDYDDKCTWFIDIFGNFWEESAGVFTIKNHGYHGSL